MRRHHAWAASLGAGCLVLSCASSDRSETVSAEALENHLVETLSWDRVLELECAKRGLAKSAPRLARSMVAMRRIESGRSTLSRERLDQFQRDALRELRVDALVRVERAQDPAALQELFDRRFGVDGEFVIVRQLLASRRLTARQLASEGAATDAASVTERMRERIAAWDQALREGTPFQDLLAQSDDRTTRRQLRSRPTRAGLIEGYNYRRYGREFANAVRRTPAGAVSPPVESSVGWHLVLVEARVVTRLEDVVDGLRAELDQGQAKPSEARRLRERLMREYGVTEEGER